MPIKQICLIITALAVVLVNQCYAQVRKPIQVEFGKGLQFASTDSLFTLSLGGRIQSMVEANQDLETKAVGIDFFIRRCRLNIQGTAFNPKFTYRIQLGFAQGDITANSSTAQNNLILRDAMLYYKANNWLRIGFGQTKLPGNRQRQVSSGNLQLVERSIANNNYTLDRDKGLWFFTNFNVKKSVIKATVAISSGEGRITSNTNGKPCYTARVEYLPFGNFSNNGDYVEADQEKEKKIKLSFAAVYSLNESASRTMGQLGDNLYNSETATIKYYGVDLFFKYRGFSLASEWYNRHSKKGIIVNAANSSQKNYIISGSALLIQSGYFITKHNEIAVRYAQIKPSSELTQVMSEQREYVAGFNHYFSKHNLKIQTDLTYLFTTVKESLIFRVSSVVAF